MENSPIPPIQQLKQRLVDWITTQPSLRAILVVGSQARRDHPADAWSDLDVIFMVRQPRRYLGGCDWFAEIEPPWLATREPTVVGGQQILHITLEGGAKVDLVIVSSAAFSLAARAIEVFRRHPTLLTLLPKMIEWHARVTSDRWSPVFEHGRFLEEWASPLVIERLREVFPPYDRAEIWRGRLVACDLFHLLARETAARLGYAYPTQLEETVIGWVRDQARESEAAPGRS